jgi:cytochrome c6
VWICAYCAAAPEAAVAYQVTNSKNAMPAFGGKLSEGDIADVAAYVIEQSEKGW